MALWQASRLSDSVAGFEAAVPAHGRSAVGGDTRLFRMIYRGNPDYYPILKRSRALWAELEAETGQSILTRCGGLSIGTKDGAYLSALLETTRINGTEHQANGATVHSNTPIDSITETENGVLITSGEKSWTFENVIIASGGWSQKLMPDYLKDATETKRIFLSWFVARDGAEFSPEKFPIFIRIHEDRSMYGAPAVDGVTVKATLDGRGRPTPDPGNVNRDFTPAEITETVDTVTEFFPGLYPNIVRTDAFPDLFTKDGNPLLGRLQEGSRIYCATGFSGAGFKNATGFGEIAANEALGKRSFEGLDFVRPERFKTS
jgi:sarcosine oxidase